MRVFRHSYKLLLKITLDWFFCWDFILILLRIHHAKFFANCNWATPHAFWARPYYYRLLFLDEDNFFLSLTLRRVFSILEPKANDINRVFHQPRLAFITFRWRLKPRISAPKKLRLVRRNRQVRWAPTFFRIFGFFGNLRSKVLIIDKINLFSFLFETPLHFVTFLHKINKLKLRGSWPACFFLNWFLTERPALNFGKNVFGMILLSLLNVHNVVSSSF